MAPTPTRMASDGGSSESTTTLRCGRWMLGRLYVAGRGQQQKNALRPPREAAAVGAVVELCVLESPPLQRLDRLVALATRSSRNPEHEWRSVDRTWRRRAPRPLWIAVVTEGGNSLALPVCSLNDTKPTTGTRPRQVAAAVADVLVTLTVPCSVVVAPVGHASETIKPCAHACRRRKEQPGDDRRLGLERAPR